MVDNLDCHVSTELKKICEEKSFSEICRLPANITSMCQPLDVGVMGPLKAKLHEKWLCDMEGMRTPEQRRRKAILMTIQAYDEITEACVKSAWQKLILRPG